MFNRNEYLARIGFIQQDSENAVERFIRLHRCHSLTIPFENFNPFCRIPVSLNLDDIFEKVIHHHRGGYCFELNFLFQELLKDFGYETRSIFCRPFSGEGVKLPLTHRLTLVYLDKKTWVADVGLGGNGWIDPLLLEPDIEQTQWNRTYRIIKDDTQGYLVQIKSGDTYRNGVAFSTTPAEESDFIMSNHYTSSHPDSPFVNRIMCTLPTPSGRYTIRDTKLKIETNGCIQETELEIQTFEDILRRYFNITLPNEMNQYLFQFLNTTTLY